MTNKKSLYIKRIVKVACFIAIFALVTASVNFAIVITNVVSEDTWMRYSKKNDIDTLFLGSSVGWVIVPDSIDELTGTNSVNMSTPDQFYKTSCRAIDFISEQQPLERVVLVTSLDSLEHSEDYVADKAFFDALYETSPLGKRILASVRDKLSRYEDGEFDGSTDSVNIWFDWVMSPTLSIATIKENIYTRKTPDENGLFMRDKYSIDTSKRPYARAAAGFDTDAKNRLEADTNAFLDMNIQSVKLDEKSLYYLDCIERYLNANGISFVLMVSPHKMEDRDKYGEEYGLLDSYLCDFVTKRGGTYINLDSDEEVRNILSDDYFTDREHLNDEGHALVTPVIADRLKAAWDDKDN